MFAALDRAGRTIMLVTHESNIAAPARRVIRLRDGRIDTVTENPADGSRDGSAGRSRVQFPESPGTTG